jgi:hypothetical protein
MGHAIGNAVNRRNIERRLLSVLAERVCRYHMSMGCYPRANEADFETLKALVWVYESVDDIGGFDYAKTGRLAKIKFKAYILTWGKGFHVLLSFLESDTVREVKVFLSVQSCVFPAPIPPTSTILITAHAITPTTCSHGCGQHVGII